MNHNFEVNGNSYQFINSSKSNRSGFKHICELTKNGTRVQNNSIQYYNRTWEAYQYQTVMHNAVANLIDEIKTGLLTDYKETSGLKRLSADKKEAIFAGSPEISELIELKQQI